MKLWANIIIYRFFKKRDISIRNKQYGKNNHAFYNMYHFFANILNISNELSTKVFLQRATTPLGGYLICMTRVVRM